MIAPCSQCEAICKAKNIPEVCQFEPCPWRNQMTARNYCPAGDCDHLTREAKAKEHGTPEEFESAIWRAQADGFVTTNEAIATIRRYYAEYEAAPTAATDPGTTGM